MICKKCGAELPEKAQFCFSCGSRIFRKRFCSKCGEPIEENYAFCIICGTNLDVAIPKSVQEPVAIDVVPEQPAEETCPDQPTQEESLPEQPAEEICPERPVLEEILPEQPEEVPPKKKKLWPLFAILGALVAVAAVLLLLPNKKPQQRVDLSGAVVYEADNCLYLRGRSGDPILLTEAFYAREDLYCLEYGQQARVIQIEPESGYIYYLDQVAYEENEGFRGQLCCRNGNGGDPVVVEDGVSEFYPNEDGVVFLQSGSQEDGFSSLFYYDRNTGKSKKIEEQVRAYIVSGERIFYLTTEGTVYTWLRGEKEKCATDVKDLVACYDTGEFYFTRECDVTYRDLIDGSEILEIWDPEELETPCTFMSFLYYFDGEQEQLLNRNYHSLQEIAPENPAIMYEELEMFTVDADLFVKEIEDEAFADFLLYDTPSEIKEYIDSEAEYAYIRRILVLGDRILAKDTEDESISHVAFHEDQIWYVIELEDGENSLYHLKGTRSKAKVIDRNIYLDGSRSLTILENGDVVYRKYQDYGIYDLYLNGNLFQRNAEYSLVEQDGIRYRVDGWTYLYYEEESYELSEFVDFTAVVGDRIYYLDMDNDIRYLGDLVCLENEKDRTVAGDVWGVMALENGSLIYCKGDLNNFTLLMWDGEQETLIAENVHCVEMAEDGALVYTISQGQYVDIYRYQDGQSIPVALETGEFAILSKVEG